jgi:hypothetical protein
LPLQKPLPIEAAEFQSKVLPVRHTVIAVLAALALAGCGGGNPLRVTRSACPAVGVVEHAGEVTLFSPATSRDAGAIDVNAAITNVRAACGESANRIVSQLSFDVVAQRANASGARTVTLPYFAVVLRAGDQLLSKQLGTVTLHFDDGSIRTRATASARSDIDRAAATLPDEITREITRERKPGDADAAIDPLAAPAVRQAVRNASFELLVGFQLDDAALAYNVGK